MKTQTSTETNSIQDTEREYLKYTFFKVDSQWRRLDNANESAAKQEFASIINRFGKQNMLSSYSLVGVRGDADFMLWTTSRRLEDFQELTSNLLSSMLGKYLEIPYSYLAITRQSEYLGTHQHEGQEGASLNRHPGNSKYLFVYPFVKKREWYFLPHEERRLAMAQHFKIGHKYPSVQIHTGYSFGLDDQEFVLAFETDKPADFSELVMELRSSEASRYTAIETPIFTCITMPINEILNLLG
ncbi:MAG: chlorite dismutase family protein [Candidatus Bathyarchaeia archaeon]